MTEQASERTSKRDEILQGLQSRLILPMTMAPVGSDYANSKDAS